MPRLVPGLALAAAVAAALLTSALNRATAAIESSAQSVYLAQEAEIDLLLHAQAASPIVKRDLEGSIDARLLRAAEFAVGALAPGGTFVASFKGGTGEEVPNDLVACLEGWERRAAPAEIRW